MELPKSKTFCIYPWSHLSMNTHGSYKPCCNTQGNLGISISDTSYIDAFNSAPMNDIRRKMLLGERPELCNTCWKKEDQGISSYRELYNKNTTLLDLIPTIDFPTLIYLDLKFDNKCNLQCIYCGESSSNQFEKASTFFKKHDIDLPFNILTTKVDFNPDNKLEKVKEIISNIRFIKVTGGEPMLSAHFNELIDYMIEKGYNDNIELTITTNLTLISIDFLNKLLKFKKVSLNISIDAVGKLYYYMRYPFTFDKFTARLDILFKYLEVHIDVLSKFVISFDCLLTSLNILNLNDLIFWVNSLPNTYKLPYEFFQNSISLNCNVHTAPFDHPLSIYRLPQLILDEAVRRYVSTDLTKNIDDIFIKLTNTMPINELLEFIRIYDLQRKTNCNDYLDSKILELFL